MEETERARQRAGVKIIGNTREIRLGGQMGNRQEVGVKHSGQIVQSFKWSYIYMGYQPVLNCIKKVEELKG